MKKEFPLFPELSEEGAKEARELINKFKKAIIKAAEEVIGDLYCDVLHDIESDSWTNFRNDLMDGLKNYDNRKIQNRYIFKEVRQSILKNHRDDIINDLNQDLIEEIKKLKETIQYLQNHRY